MNHTIHTADPLKYEAQKDHKLFYLTPLVPFRVNPFRVNPSPQMWRGGNRGRGIKKCRLHQVIENLYLIKNYGN